MKAWLASVRGKMTEAGLRAMFSRLVNHVTADGYKLERDGEDRGRGKSRQQFKIKKLSA